MYCVLYLRTYTLNFDSSAGFYYTLVKSLNNALETVQNSLNSPISSFNPLHFRYESGTASAEADPSSSKLFD